MVVHGNTSIIHATSLVDTTMGVGEHSRHVLRYRADMKSTLGVDGARRGRLSNPRNDLHEPCHVFAVQAAAGCRRYKAQYLISPEAMFVYQYSAGTCGIVSSNGAISPYVRVYSKDVRASPSILLLLLYPLSDTYFFHSLSVSVDRAHVYSGLHQRSDQDKFFIRVSLRP
ncbi:hypothetical protein CBL_11815 [Carabus blaptoides fortunei]